jgi:protein-disulfide isomerase
MSLRRFLVALSLPLAACANKDGNGAANSQPPASNLQPPASNLQGFDLTAADKARQMGSETAKVWFIMGSDFECPYCKLFHDETWPRIDREYVQTGKIRVAFMNHPMSLKPPVGSMHPLAIPAAEAAMCAASQGKFWAMHDSLFMNQDKWAKGGNPQPVFEALAQSVGVKMDDWKSCVSSHAPQMMIEGDFAKTTHAGIEGTPSFIIGNELSVVGAAPYPKFKEAIDAALAKAGK